jgi:hypothetical protein
MGFFSQSFSGLFILLMKEWSSFLAENETGLRGLCISYKNDAITDKRTISLK